MEPFRGLRGSGSIEVNLRAITESSAEGGILRRIELGALTGIRGDGFPRSVMERDVTSVPSISQLAAATDDQLVQLSSQQSDLPHLGQLLREVGLFRVTTTSVGNRVQQAASRVFSNVSRDLPLGFRTSEESAPSSEPSRNTDLLRDIDLSGLLIPVSTEEQRGNPTIFQRINQFIRGLFRPQDRANVVPTRERQQVPLAQRVTVRRDEARVESGRPNTGLDLNSLNLTSSEIAQVTRLWNTFSRSFETFQSSPGIAVLMTRLKERPWEIFEELYATFFDSSFSFSDTSLRIKFQDENGALLEGLDQGGLTQELIDRLFSGVERQHRDNPFKIENGNPIFQENDKQVYGYFVMGCLIGFCLLRLRDEMGPKYLIGSLFERNFFEALKEISIEESRQEVVSDELLLKVFGALKKGDSVFENLFGFLRGITNENRASALEIAYLDEEVKEGVTDAEIQAKIKELLLTRAKIYVLPLLFIVQGIQRSYPDWDLIRTQKSAAEFDTGLQGVPVDVGLLGDKLKIYFDVQRQNERRVLSQLFMRWIEENKENKELLGQFVFAATGSHRMKNDNIYIRLKEGEWDIPERNRSLPEFHTCGKEFHIAPYTHYEIFKEKLERGIREALLGDYTIV